MPSATIDETATVRAGLLRPLPELDARFFYDDRGSELFEQITGLPEYYPTRTEIGILEANADAIVVAAGAEELAELGSGAGRKIRLLLDAMARTGQLKRCAMFDINASFLQASVERLRDSYPGVQVDGVVGNFLQDLACLGPGGRRMVILLAGTIGNLEPARAAVFLKDIQAHLGDGDSFLVGIDLVKSRELLEAAYNDAQGVTARFNLNILAAVNRRFDTRFVVEDFEHHAFWDEAQSRIEMRLRAIRATEWCLPGGGEPMQLEAGGEIRTEFSCKYTRAMLDSRAAAADLRVTGWWTDPQEWFALALLKPIGP